MIHFKHNCSRCKYLGEYVGPCKSLKQFSKFDLYVCPGNIDILIARYSDFPMDYISMDFHPSYVPDINSEPMLKAVELFLSIK